MCLGIGLLVGDRTFKLSSGTTSEYGRCVKSLGEPVAGSWHPTARFNRSVVPFWRRGRAPALTVSAVGRS